MKASKFNKNFIILFSCLLITTSCNHINEMKLKDPVVQLNHIKTVASQLGQEINNIEENKTEVQLKECCKLVTEICNTWKSLIVPKLVNIPEINSQQNISLLDLKLKLEQYYQGANKKEIINLTSTLTVCHSILMDDENIPRHNKFVGNRETTSLQTYLNIDVQPICNILITNWETTSY